MKNSNKKGFTLLELLVVIAIIGILATLIIVSVDSARKKARDSRRMSDIKQIQNAIELYIAAKGVAPNLGSSDCLVPLTIRQQQNQWYASGCWVNDMNNSGIGVNWAYLESQLAPYISQLPKDPCGKACYRESESYLYRFFTYRYDAPESTGNATSPTDYKIYAQNLETKRSAFGFGSF